MGAVEQSVIHYDRVSGLGFDAALRRVIAKRGVVGRERIRGRGVRLRKERMQWNRSMVRPRKNAQGAVFASCVVHVAEHRDLGGGSF